MLQLRRGATPRSVGWRAGTALSLAVLVAAGGAATSLASTAKSSGTASAQAAIKPYVNHVSAFPVSTPLGGKLPKRTLFVLMEPSVSAGATLAQYLTPAIRAIGGRFKTINAGVTASTTQEAAASALALHPSVVFTSAISPALYGNGLKKLAAQGAKIISFAATGPTKKYGITFSYIGQSALEEAGRLMADWVITHKGPGAKVAFYGVPEIPFTPYMENAFKQELAKNCPTCSVRFVSIDITAMGTTSAQTIVTDLQANTSTNYLVFGVNQLEDGLPAAMQSAGLSVPQVIFTPETEEVQNIKNSNGEIAGLASDLPTQIWTGVDIAARLILHEKLTPGEISGFGPFEFLTSSNAKFNSGNEWTGYPNYATRFTKLWKEK